MLERESVKKIKSKLESNKIILILGSPENINDINLWNEFSTDNEIKLLDCSDKKVKKVIQSTAQNEIKLLFEDKKNIILKEAQNLDNLQQLIEAVLIHNLDINLICLCSFKPILDELLTEVLESQELIIKIASPSFKEIAKHFGLIQIEKNLEERLIFGNSEHVFGNKEKAIHFLEESVQKIIKTSLNAKERINKTESLRLLLQNIALNIGQHISYNELGIKSNLDNETVERYIDLLHEAQILIKLPAYNTNQKYELKKTHCIYFYDNGIRNAVIKNFNALEFRNDKDELWKNWFIAEKIKKQADFHSTSKFYCWVTHTKQKVDLIEVKSTQVNAFQMKWNKKEKNKFPKSFSDYYPTVKLNEINRSTYWSFLAKD